jgi:hypothetical protein
MPQATEDELVADLKETREYLASLADKQADQRGDYLYRGVPDASLITAIRRIDAVIARASTKEQQP